MTGQSWDYTACRIEQVFSQNPHHNAQSLLTKSCNLFILDIV